MVALSWAGSTRGGVIAGAVGPEQRRTDRRADLPVVGESVDVALGDAVVEVAADVLLSVAQKRSN